MNKTIAIKLATTSKNLFKTKLISLIINKPLFVKSPLFTFSSILKFKSKLLTFIKFLILLFFNIAITQNNF